MAIIKDAYSAKIAYFHSFNLGNTSDGIVTSQATTKSNHSIQSDDVKIENIPFAPDSATAQVNATNNPDIIKYYDKVTLTMVIGSNKQAWYYAGENGTGYIDKWISPLDSLNGFAQSPGYMIKLYDQNNKELAATKGGWLCNYNNGLILIQADQIPGKGEFAAVTSLKASFYAYVGKTVSDLKTAVTGSLEWTQI